MALLKYTTKIAAEKTGHEIQKMLAAAGAQAILFEYGPTGLLSALSFRINTPYGMISFRLPARTEGVLKILDQDVDVPGRFVTDEQAMRVGWRILKSWVESQLALVSVEMTSLTEVFLPYAQNDSGQTVYQQLENTEFKMLTKQ